MSIVYLAMLIMLVNVSLVLSDHILHLLLLVIHVYYNVHLVQNPRIIVFNVHKVFKELCKLQFVVAIKVIIPIQNNLIVKYALLVVKLVPVIWDVILV